MNAVEHRNVWNVYRAMPAAGAATLRLRHELYQSQWEEHQRQPFLLFLRDMMNDAERAVREGAHTDYAREIRHLSGLTIADYGIVLVAMLKCGWRIGE